MSDHTPGPWIPRPSAHQREYSHWIETATRETGQIHGTIAAVLNAGHPETEANACLIAAAPDLLAAAKRALLAFELMFPSRPVSDHEPMRMLDAAIAKAEGKG